VTLDMVNKLKLDHPEWDHPGWLTFNDLWSSKRQIIALTNDADKLGETYIFPGYGVPGSILRSFSADRSDPKILIDSLHKNVS
jgi:hypothetical protein